MKTGEVIGMALFGLPVLGAIVWSIREGAKQRVQVKRYAAIHGVRVSSEMDARLNTLLEETAPDDAWQTTDVMQVEPAPESTYLFSYQVSRKDKPSSSSSGHACLAEHTDGRNCR